MGLVKVENNTFGDSTNFAVLGGWFQSVFHLKSLQTEEFPRLNTVGSLC